MKSLGLTPEQMRMRKQKQSRRNYKRDRARRLEYDRAYQKGTHKDWWKKACIKAGVAL